MNKKQLAGFTLLEMMIVVAIIGILVAIAVPSYRGYVERTNRKAAIAKMLETQQLMERGYTVNNGTYTVPSSIDQPEGYTIAVTLGKNNQLYTMTATAKGSQTNDACGNLTMDSLGGQKSSKGSGCFR